MVASSAGRECRDEREALPVEEECPERSMSRRKRTTGPSRMVTPASAPSTRPRKKRWARLAGSPSRRALRSSSMEATARFGTGRTPTSSLRSWTSPDVTAPAGVGDLPPLAVHGGEDLAVEEGRQPEAAGRERTDVVVEREHACIRRAPSGVEVDAHQHRRPGKVGAGGPGGQVLERPLPGEAPAGQVA